MKDEKFEELPYEEKARRIKILAALLKAAAHPVRLQIIYLLAGQEVSVKGLQDHLELPYPTISHHLTYLRRVRMVTCHREGTAVFYWLHDTRLLKLIDEL